MAILDLPRFFSNMDSVLISAQWIQYFSGSKGNNQIVVLSLGLVLLQWEDCLI